MSSSSLSIASPLVVSPQSTRPPHTDQPLRESSSQGQPPQPENVEPAWSITAPRAYHPTLPPTPPAQSGGVHPKRNADPGTQKFSRDTGDRPILQQLSASEADIGRVLRHQPTFQATTRKAFQEELGKQFPRLSQPIDPDQIYVTQYTDDVTHRDSNGTPVRRATSTQSLSEVLQTYLTTGIEPTYDTGSTGFYRNRTAHADGDKIRAISAPVLEKMVRNVGDNSLAGYQRAQKNFWTQTHRELGLPLPPQSYLAISMGAQRRSEGQLLASDGTLEPAAKTLLDRLLNTDNQTAAVDPPGKFSLSLKDTAHSTDFPIRGAVVVTNHPGEQPDQTTGPVLVLIPGQGLQAFTNGASYTSTMQTLFAVKEQRDLLLGYVTQKDRQQAESTDNNTDGVAWNHRPMAGSAFDYSMRSLLEQQNQNVAHNTPRSLEPQQAPGNTLADKLSVNGLIDSRNEKRSLKAIADLQPEWLTHLVANDRQRLQALQQTAEDRSNQLKPLLERIPSLHRFSNTNTKEALQKQYPGHDIDPDQIQVTMTTTTEVRLPSWPESSGVAADSPATFTRSRTLSLTDYALENVAPWERAPPGVVAHVTMHSEPLKDTAGKAIVDSSGKPVVLTKQPLEALVKPLDIGQKYTDLLKAELSPDARAGDAKTLRDTWKAANAATMQSDAAEASLNPAAATTFTWPSQNDPYGKKRGLQWVDAMLKPHDPNTLPTVDGHLIEASYLTMGAANAKGGGGQVIHGVVAISEKNRSPTAPVVLYTPDAPDGVPYRELDHATTDIDRLLTKPEWKDYFSARMATHDKDEITRILSSRNGSQGTSRLKPIEGDLQEAMYKEYSGFLLAHADYRSTSNAEASRQSTFNKVMFGIDVGETLLDLIPLRKGFSLWRKVGGEGLQQLLDRGKLTPGLIPKIRTGGTATSSFLTAPTNYNRYAVPASRINGLAPNAAGIYRATDSTYYIRANDNRVFQIKSDFTVGDKQVQLINPRTRQQTGVFLEADEQGQWRKIGSNNPSQSLPFQAPPKANVSEADLLACGSEGTYPGKRGNQYVRIDDDFYQVQHDAYFNAWKIVDPTNPYAFSGAIPIRRNEYGQWVVIDNLGLLGGSPLSQLLAPKYRKARDELDRFIAGPREPNSLSDAQRQAFGGALGKLAGQRTNPDTLPAIHNYIHVDSNSINTLLRNNQSTPRLEEFINEFVQLDAYDGPAYRTAYVTPEGGQRLRSGVGLTFRDEGVQSASTQPVNVFGWEESWAGNAAPGNAPQKVVYIYDSTIPKRNMSTSFLRDHVAIPPGTPTKALAVKEQDGRLYVYMSSPSKVPEHAYNVFNGAQIY